MYDIIIKNGRIYDGTGGEAYVADIGIKDGTIAAVGSLNDADCLRLVDAASYIVTPGFIDVHSHGDATVMMFPEAQSHLMQGITTFIGGLCGDSVAPLSRKSYFRNFWEYDNWHRVDGGLYSSNLLQEANSTKQFLESKYPIKFTWETFDEYLTMLEDTGMSINFLPFVGHSQMRVAAMDTISDRRPDSVELKTMCRMAQTAMEAGAWGVSTGLDYAPSKYACDDEIDSILNVIKKYDGIYSTHWRTSFKHDDELSRYSKKDGLIHACETARRFGLRTEISHISSVYEIHPTGTDDIERMLARETTRIIDDYIASGADIAFNIAPNTTYGFKCIPYLAMYFAPLVRLSGGAERFSENLRYAEYVEDVKSLIKAKRSGVFSPAQRLGWANGISVTRSSERRYEGRTVCDIASELGLSHIDTVFELLRSNPYINVKEDVITYASVEAFLCHERAMVCLDGYIFDDVSTFGREDGIPEILPNPTGYCGFLLFLTKFNRLSLKEKIKKITGNPALWYGISGRGFIREGMAADINVIDINNLKPDENHINPMTYPTGMVYVIVNGQIVVENGSHTGARPGAVIRRK